MYAIAQERTNGVAGRQNRSTGFVIKGRGPLSTEWPSQAPAVSRARCNSKEFYGALR